MTKLHITRIAHTPHGVFGRLTMPDGETLYTVERPWADNIPRLSCIPEGKYKCGPRYYNRGGYRAVEVKDVPERKYIMFHKGNKIGDSLGCILVNSRLGCLDGEWCGLNSRLAFKRFMHFFGNQNFTLIIERGI